MFKRWSLIIVPAMLAALLPAVPARAATEIQFLNPSDYTTNTQLSDKTDTDGTYHLVVWVSEVPDSPLVEFEVQPTAGLPTTVDATRAANDTWEAFLSLSQLADGQYTIRARVYSNLNEVASTQKIVTVNSNDPTPPADPNTVEMLYPENGGAAGFFTPEGKASNVVIDGVASEGAAQVRALYTLSAPGSDPEWKQCGTATVGTAGAVRVLCTLTDGDAGSAVKALALVSNVTPTQTGAANPAADQTGDAHRVIPYVQQPHTLEINPTAVMIAPSTCGAFVAAIKDKNGRPIAAANVDAHAVGPDDQLRFGSQTNVTSGYQAPDKGHPSNEPSWNCSSGAVSATLQGDHNAPGQDDTKHIESTSGTNKDGLFTFAMVADSIGSTVGDVYADVDDDDVQDVSEASGGFRIGWGEAPPGAVTEAFIDPSSPSPTTGECQRMVAVVKRGGNPLNNTNVDIHITGPDPTSGFCSPSDGTTLRAPDQGHVGDTHEDGTRHAEAETDNVGRVIFGVTAPTEGAMQVQIWNDSSDDDVLSSEPSDTAAINWQPVGARDISLQSSRSRVRAGRNVTFSGRITGSNTCRGSQDVVLQRKRISRGSYKRIDETTTDSQGDFSLRVRINKSRKYRARVDASGVCEAASSNAVVVRVRR